MNTFRMLGWGLVGLLWLGAPALAQDGQCASDADCDAGFVCEVVGGGGCDAVYCDGADCPPQPTCDAVDIYGCVPGPCDTDADCGDGQVCHEFVEEECSGATAAPCEETPEGVVCEAPDPVEPECTTTSERMCTPTWALPCEADNDCGPGFTCEEAESCWCSGGGTACPDNDPTCEPVVEEPQCGCDPTGEFYCALVITECGADSDCADGLVCADNPERAVCSSAVDGGVPDQGGAAGSAGGAGSSAGDADTASGDGDCGTDTTPAQVCMPADYLSYGGGHGRGYDYSAQSAEGGGTGVDGNGEKADEDSGSGGGDATVGLCSVSQGRNGQGAPMLLWLMGAAALLWTRRRRA